MRHFRLTAAVHPSPPRPLVLSKYPVFPFPPFLVPDMPIRAISIRAMSIPDMSVRVMSVRAMWTAQQCVRVTENESRCYHRRPQLAVLDVGYLLDARAPLLPVPTAAGSAVG